MDKKKPAVYILRIFMSKDTPANLSPQLNHTKGVQAGLVIDDNNRGSDMVKSLLEDLDTLRAHMLDPHHMPLEKQQWPFHLLPRFLQSCYTILLAGGS